MIIYGDALFHKAIFNGNTDFTKVIFRGYTSFSESIFSESADFSESVFNIYTNFYKTIFNGSADFSKAKFKKSVEFKNAIFNDSTSFQNSTFEQLVSLQECQFTNSVPDFNYVTYKQAPTLDDVGISFSSKKGINELERYRKLKVIAQDGNDHENELRFFGYETHAKAYKMDKGFLRNIINFPRWFIKCYYWFSNFGTSFLRPWLCIVAFLFCMFIVNQTWISPSSDECTNYSNSPSVYQHNLLTFTLSQSLPLVTLGKDQREFMDECLFGKNHIKTLKHSIWRVVHFVPTTLFLFLFGLAVRNRFKIS